MNIISLLYVSLLIISSSTIANEQGVTGSQLIHQAKRECNSFENGQFNATKYAIYLQDVTGDGKPEEIIDASQFSCSSAISMWSGSGGTYLWVIVEGKAYEFLASKWRLIDMDGQKILLLAVSSSECGDTIGPCYRALVWSRGFRTTH